MGPCGTKVQEFYKKVGFCSHFLITKQNIKIGTLCNIYGLCIVNLLTYINEQWLGEYFVTWMNTKHMNTCFLSLIGVNEKLQPSWWIVQIVWKMVRNSFCLPCRSITFIKQLLGKDNLCCFGVIFCLGPAMPPVRTQGVVGIARAASVVPFFGVVTFCKIVWFSVPFFTYIYIALAITHIHRSS